MSEKVRTRTARRHPALEAHVTRRTFMVYDTWHSDGEDRPAHVRAASGLSAFREYLAVVQDDANWLALIDAEDRIHAVPLPPGPGGARLFSEASENKHDKFDLEACITVPGEKGHELIGFASGSHPGREWILRVHEGTCIGRNALKQAIIDPQGQAEFTAEFVEAGPFYDSLRRNRAFCGSGLNIEGAVLLGSRILLFQRGNAPARDELEPVDATAAISWPALRAHLADPFNVPPPELARITHYDLGELDGVRLTFSDAEPLGGERILFSASAEDSRTGRIAGSVLGIIDADGCADWAELTDRDGSAFRGKIEGLSRSPRVPRKIYFVVDDDDESVPSELFEAQLSGGFLGS